MSQRRSNLKDDIENFKYSFDNVQRLAEFADSKANILLAINSLVITILVTIIVTNDLKLLISNSDNFIGIIGWIIILMSLLLMLKSSIDVISVINPRDADKEENKEKSVFYYKTIAEFDSLDLYIEECSKLDDARIVKSIAHQAYEVSDIVDKKMKLIQSSLKCMKFYLFGLILGGILIILGLI